MLIQMEKILEKQFKRVIYMYGCEDKFPPKYGRLVLNKEDFEYSLIPIVQTKKQI